MSATATVANEPADHPAQPTRGRILWAVLGTVAGAQLLAFWMICSHQVRMAEARQTESLVQQMALADCLQYVPGSTIASCASTVAGVRPTQPGAIAVSYAR